MNWKFWKAKPISLTVCQCGHEPCYHLCGTDACFRGWCECCVYIPAVWPQREAFMSAEQFWRTSPKYYPANKQEKAWEFAEAYAQAALEHARKKP
jgi:hypothetical protein